MLSRTLVGFCLAIVLVVVGAVATLAIARWRAAEALAIDGPNGIDEEQFVRIGDVEQWVTVRGRDRANPVILVVGGVGRDGPGTVLSPFQAPFRDWERDFTVVRWDQRGAGKTYARAGRTLGPDLTFDRIVADGLDLTGYLERRLGKRKIVLMGTAFGSTVAARMALMRPELYSADVGAGQIADPRKDREKAGFDRLVRLATQRGDQASLADLKISGPWAWRPPRDPVKVAAFVRVAGRYHAPNPPNQAWDVLTAPHWSVTDALAVSPGMAASEARLGADWAERFDYSRLGPEFRLPVFVIQGDDNTDAPIVLAAAWLDRIRAPSKMLIPIPGAGTHGLQTHPLAFLRALDRAVRPLAMAGS